MIINFRRKHPPHLKQLSRAESYKFLGHHHLAGPQMEQKYQNNHQEGSEAQKIPLYLHTPCMCMHHQKCRNTSSVKKREGKIIPDTFFFSISQWKPRIRALNSCTSRHLFLLIVSQFLPTGHNTSKLRSFQHPSPLTYSTSHFTKLTQFNCS